MDNFQKKLALSGIMILGLPLLSMPSAFAAKPVNLRHQNMTVLHSMLGADGRSTQIKEVSRNLAKNNTLHVRIQQTYQGHEIYGADAVIHFKNSGKQLRASSLQSLAGSKSAGTSMNGVIYQDLAKDLANTPKTALAKAQADKAMQQATATFAHEKGGKTAVSEKQTKLMIFIDEANKAHWAYHVSFRAEASKAGKLPAKPNYIMDAQTLKVFAKWDDIKTIDDKDLNEVDAGGFGGNLKMGKVSYDGQEGDLHYAKLVVNRDDESKTCYMENSDVVVKDYYSRNIMSFNCATVDDEHAGLYWDGDEDAVNGGYSPSNDALFGGWVIKNMYRDWYDMPVLTNSDGSPMLLTMVVHDPIDNAYWDGRQMTFGDGVSMFYPLTSLGVAAHEISHGFTEQHSGLRYWGQSGGMNEAFSDMAAQAAEVFAYGKNSWQIGPEIFKREDEALRYMDQPSKDCNGGEPGNWCSIDDASQYYSGLDVHFSSGVYNRAFYLMGTADGWDARKAFDVMVHANANYWTSGTSFSEGACGVISAAKDLGYDAGVVQNAFETVLVDITDCE